MLPLTHVQPGNLITSELINAIIDQLNGLGGRPGDLPLTLGPLAAQTGTLVALGTGFEANGGIWLDGQPLLSGAPTRGISLVILNPSLKVKFRGAYDTFGDAASSARLVQDLQSAAQPFDIVAGVTHDAFAYQLQPNAKSALASVGGAALGLAAPDTRSAAAFIGVVPANRANAQFNYIVSVLPPDAAGFGGSPKLAGLPFAWGVYSIPMQRFLLGGASAQWSAASSLPTIPTMTFPTLGTTFPTLTFPTLTTIFPTVTFPTATFPTLTTFVVPTLTFTLPTENFATLPPGFGFVQPGDEITALPGIGMAEKEMLSNVGVTRVDELVNMPVENVAKALNISNEAAAGLIGKARFSLGGQ